MQWSKNKFFFRLRVGVKKKLELNIIASTGMPNDDGSVIFSLTSFIQIFDNLIQSPVMFAYEF